MALICSGINSVFSLFGFLFFIWWWNEKGGASWIYKYITLLLLAEVIQGLYFLFPQFQKTLLFQFVFLPHAIVIAAIVFHVIYRVFFIPDRSSADLEHISRNTSVDIQYSIKRLERCTTATEANHWLDLIRVRCKKAKKNLLKISLKKRLDNGKENTSTKV